MVTEEDVRAAYRLMLGREPESDEVVGSLARTTQSLHELRERFVTSPEVHFASRTRYASRSLDWSPIEMEIDASASQFKTHRKALNVLVSDAVPHD